VVEAVLYSYPGRARYLILYSDTQFPILKFGEILCTEHDTGLRYGRTWFFPRAQAELLRYMNLYCTTVL
jgi:hypothetical protein